MAGMQPGGPDQPGNQYGGAGNGMGGVVGDDTLCSRCSYPLRGVPLDGTCPQCGTTVNQTLTSARLHMADGRWLATVAKGLRWNWMLFVGIIAYSFFLGLVNAATSLGGNSYPNLIAFLSLPFVPVAGLRLWAWWQVAAPDPTPNRPSETEPLRHWIRRLVIVEAVIQGISLIPSMVLLATGFYERFDGFNKAWAGSRYATMPNISDTFTQTDLVFGFLNGLCIAGSFVVVLAAFFCGVIYLRNLAVRAGDLETVKFAKTVMIAAPICATVLICLCGLGPMIAQVLWVMLLIKTEGMIRKCLAWQAQWLPRAS